jgi:hypothetical protein
MPTPTEHKTVQARILAYAEAIGWTFVSQKEAEQRRGLARRLGDYVIVHELLHFSVPNHGKLWKSLMRAHLGDHESLLAALPKCNSR